MTKKEALKLADVAYSLLLASYGFSVFDSGDFADLALSLMREPKVREWMRFIIPDSASVDEREVMTKVLVGLGIQPYEDKDNN